MILLCILAIITWKRDAQGDASNSRTIFLCSVVKLPLRKPIIHQVKLSKVTQLCGFMFQFLYMLLKSMLKIILSLRNQHENNQSTINFLVWSHGLLIRIVPTWAPGSTDSYSMVVTVNSYECMKNHRNVIFLKSERCWKAREVVKWKHFVPKVN